MKASHFFLICAATVATTGCASYDQQYVNWRGEVHACDQFGFGVLGSQLASKTHQACESSMRTLGYLNVESTGRSGLALEQATSLAGDAPITISSVDLGSSAAKSGIEMGDELVEVDRVPIRSLRVARRALFGAAGSVVLVKTRRGNVTSVDELVRQSSDDINGKAVVAKASGGAEAPY